MKIGLAVSLFLLIAPVALWGQCPEVKVIGPQGITGPNENIEFRAEVGGAGPKLEYSWELDKGIIIDGQGTPKITVSTFALGGEAVTATVQIKGLPDNCSNSSSLIVEIGRPQVWCWAETWTELKPNEIRGRLDSLFAELSNNPSQVAFIQLRVTHEEKFDLSNSRVQFILNHAKYRKFDIKQLWFSLELAEEPRTSYTRIEPESEKTMPCDQCLIIKGEHL